MPQSVQERREERIGKIGDRLTDKTELRLRGEGFHQGKSDIDMWYDMWNSFICKSLKASSSKNVFREPSIS